MSEDRLKQVDSTTRGAFSVVLYLTADNRYKALISRSDGKKIRTHEGDDYADIPTPTYDTADAALKEAFHLIETGGMS